MNEKEHEESWKDRLIKIRDQAIKVIYHPTMIKVSRFATDVLEATYVVDPKNPLSVGSAAMALVDSAVTAFDLPQLTKLDYFADNKKLVQYNGSLARVMIEAKLHLKYPTNLAIKLDNNMIVKELILDANNKIYYIENVDPSTAFADPVDRIYFLFYTTVNFDFDKLFNAIWDCYSGGIFLSKTASNNPQGGIKLNKLVSNDYMYIGDLDIDNFAADIIRCRAESLSRSFMLVGPAGCGKSSFSINVAQKISNKILKIDPTATRLIGSVELDFIIKNLRPDVIIFDDFDRAALSHDSEHLLFLLENLKMQNPKLVIFATVNEFYRLDKALVRPGRFDEIIWFDEPTNDAKRRVLIAYLEKYSLEFDEDLIQDIISKTVGMSPVYVKELCLRIKRKGIACIDSVISEFRRSMYDDGDSCDVELMDDDLNSVSDEEIELCIEEQTEEVDDEQDFIIPTETKFGKILKRKRKRKHNEDKSLWSIPRR